MLGVLLLDGHRLVSRVGLVCWASVSGQVAEEEVLLGLDLGLDILPFVNVLVVHAHELWV